METTKKKRAPEGAQTQPLPPLQAVAPAADVDSELRRRFKAVKAKAMDLQGLLKRISQLNHLDVVCILGLVDLLEFGDHCEDTDNWLGSFMYDLLLNIGRDGVVKIANDPDGVRQMLEDRLNYLMPDLERARDFVARYPKLVAQLPIMAAGGGSEVEPCQ
jgi:hypothetical protein